MKLIFKGEYKLLGSPGCFLELPTYFFHRTSQIDFQVIFKFNLKLICKSDTIRQGSQSIFTLFCDVDNNGIPFIISCANQDEYNFNYTSTCFFFLTDIYIYITYMYSILKIYIEVYVHVLNVHLTNCLFLRVSL